MSLPMEVPCARHIASFGLGVFGGHARSFNKGGRLTKYLPETEEFDLAIDAAGVACGPVRSGAQLYAYLNGRFQERGKDRVYRFTRYGLQEDLYVDIVPLPEAYEWQGFQPYFGTRLLNLKVTWSGDSDTERYIVRHDTDANHATSRIVAILTKKDEITVTNDTANGEEITVEGHDGHYGKDGNYTITVNYDGTDRTVTVVDNNTGSTLGPVDWEDLPIAFGRALSVTLPETWTASGDTVFSVTTTISKEFIFLRPSSGTHYFQIEAQREDGDTETSSWVSKAISRPPSPVDDVSVSFVSDDTVEISFTMPSDSDIAGWRVYHSREWDTGNLIPHWHPRAVGTAGPSDPVSVEITGLEAGDTYTFYVRAYSDSGLDDETTNLYVYHLLTTAVSPAALVAPESISVKATGAGAVTVTIQSADNAEDTCYVYDDDGTGTIDYATARESVSSASRDSSGKYIRNYTGLTEGTWKFAARFGLSSAREFNTNIVFSAFVFGSSLAAPSSVTVVETGNG